MSVYYDQDLALSGGVQVEYQDFSVFVIGTAIEDDSLVEETSFNLRIKNPCFDPAF